MHSRADEERHNKRASTNRVVVISAAQALIPSYDIHVVVYWLGHIEHGLAAAQEIVIIIILPTTLPIVGDSRAALAIGTAPLNDW